MQSLERIALKCPDQTDYFSAGARSIAFATKYLHRRPIPEEGVTGQAVDEPNSSLEHPVHLLLKWLPLFNRGIPRIHALPVLMIRSYNSSA